MAVTAERISDQEQARDGCLEIYDASLQDHQAVMRRELTRINGERPKMTGVIVENLQSEVDTLCDFLKEGCMEEYSLNYAQVEARQALELQAADMPEYVEYEDTSGYSKITIPLRRVTAISGRVVPADWNEPYAFNPIVDIRIPAYDLQELEQSAPEEIAAAKEERPFIYNAWLQQQIKDNSKGSTRQWFSVNLLTGWFSLS